MKNNGKAVAKMIRTELARLRDDGKNPTGATAWRGMDDREAITKIALYACGESA